jgi:deoxyribodipyrimidine photolyase
MVNTWFRVDGYQGTRNKTAIVLFTRDLRLHDNPALHQACSRA